MTATIHDIRSKKPSSSSDDKAFSIAVEEAQARRDALVNAKGKEEQYITRALEYQRRILTLLEELAKLHAEAHKK